MRYLPAALILLAAFAISGFLEHAGRGTPPEIADSRSGVLAKSDLPKSPAACEIPGTRPLPYPVRTGPIELAPIAETAAELNAAGGDITADLQIVGGLVDYFRRLHQANPIGLNHEIVRQLQGNTPRRIGVLPSECAALSASGELLDRWGTPFFFHQQSGTEMEIVSAGPDRELWTNDDARLH